MKFRKHLKECILKNEGVLTLDHFLSLVIPHYYSNNNPFGEDGDFITAPEISQMYGEIIGIWLADFWYKNNCPKFNLVEIGPGKGTLMMDLLRGIHHIGELKSHLQKIILIESSQTLREVQKAKLRNYNNIYWAEHVDQLNEKYTIFIANEFFDALPIKQFVKKERGFHEVYIGLKDEQFSFYLSTKTVNLEINCKEHSVIEISSPTSSYARFIGNFIHKHGGGGLFIDYGYIEPTYQSTLQAIHKHNKVHPLHRIGEADITAHVDFLQLKNIFLNSKLEANIVGQGEFLKNYGIEQRAAILIKGGADANKIHSEIYRLTNSEEMGTLFKVLEVK